MMRSSMKINSMMRNSRTMRASKKNPNSKIARKRLKTIKRRRLRPRKKMRRHLKRSLRRPLERSRARLLSMRTSYSTLTSKPKETR